MTKNPALRKNMHKYQGNNVDQFKVIKRFFTKEEAYAYEKHLHTVCNYDGQNMHQSHAKQVTDILTDKIYANIRIACEVLGLKYHNELSLRRNQTSRFKNVDGTGDHTDKWFQWLDTKTNIKYRELREAVEAAGLNHNTVANRRYHNRPTQFERIC